MKQFAVILMAAGQSRRFLKDQNSISDQQESRNRTFAKKPFISLRNDEVFFHSAREFAACPDVGQIILTVAPEDRMEVERLLGSKINSLSIKIAEGGAERWQSVENALKFVRPDLDFVAVHDAARPCISKNLIERVFQTARRTGAAIPATPVSATLKKASIVYHNELSANSEEKEISVRWNIERTVDRSNLWEAQTPQVFRKDLLLEAYRCRGDLIPTDDAQLVEALGKSVEIVPSDLLNIKITTENDLKIAEKFLELIDRNSSTN